MWIELALCTPLALSQVPLPSKAAVAPAGAKLALLVGIDRYAPGTPAVFANLNGCVRDTARVQELLVGRFGFAPENIRTLTNEHATHAAIVRAFHDDLIARAREDTEVVFWFSGHGSRVPDVSGAAGAEKDKKDSTLLAYDSRVPGLDGAWDFCDDELRSLLFALTRKTARVTVITDSCHSGGATRGAGLRPGEPRYRGADEGKLPLDRERLRREAWPEGIDLFDDGDEHTDEAERHVHIAACAQDQLAQEVDFAREDGTSEPGGALTYFLTQALDRAQPGQTYRDVAEQAAMRLATRLANQNVRYQGAISRELFGARFAERPQGFLARAAGAGVRIEAGRMLLLGPGSIVELYTQAGAAIGKAEVVSAGDASATAKWCPPAPSPVPEGALHAIEVSRPPGQEPLALCVEDPRLAELLEDDARVVLLALPRPDAYRLSTQSQKMALHEPSGIELWSSTEKLDPSAGLPKELDQALQNELRHQALDALALQPGTLRVNASFRAPTAAEVAEWKSITRLDAARSAQPEQGSGGAADGEGRIYTASGTVDSDTELALAMIEVENPGKTPLYVSILSVSEDRKCDLIWPSSGAHDRALEPGKRMRSVPVNVTFPASWQPGRRMRDRYLLVATREAIDLSPLVTRERLRSAGTFPGVLETAAEGLRTRGSRGVRIDRPDWGITALDLLVERGSAAPGPKR